MQGPLYSNSTSSAGSVRMRAWRVNSLNATSSAKHYRSTEHDATEPPSLALKDVETNVIMGQVDGLFKDLSPSDRRPNGLQKLQSSPVVPSGVLSPMAPSSEHESPTWSSAIGHASTGKSGRVIERLQADIDRLNRDLHLLKARLNDSEKARETLAIHKSNLQDRNSNNEQLQEATGRQMQRKDRMIDELRENLSREKLRVAAAEQNAKEAAANEETWRDTASHSRSRVEQKEAEYATIVACRNMESQSYRGSLSKLKHNFRSLAESRARDQERYDKLQLIAEQQGQTIAHLQELSRKTNTNFQAYRSEVDRLIAEMRAQVGSNEASVLEKTNEMGQITGKMKWVIGLDRSRKLPAPGFIPGDSPSQLTTATTTTTTTTTYD